MKVQSQLVELVTNVTLLLKQQDQENRERDRHIRYIYEGAYSCSTASAQVLTRSQLAKKRGGPTDYGHMKANPEILKRSNSQPTPGPETSQGKDKPSPKWQTIPKPNLGIMTKEKGDPQTRETSSPKGATKPSSEPQSKAIPSQANRWKREVKCPEGTSGKEPPSFGPIKVNVSGKLSSSVNHIPFKELVKIPIIKARIMEF